MKLISPVYVSEIIEILITNLIPYINGDIDNFEIDFNLDEKISSIGELFEEAIFELHLVETLSNDVIIPIAYHKVSGPVSNSVGINFTNEEFNHYFHEVMPIEWIEQNLINGVYEGTYYFSGKSDNLNINIPVSDRVNLIGEVFKDKYP